MNETEQTLTEAVAQAIHDASRNHIPDMGAWDTDARRYPDYGDRVRDEATAAIAAVRQFDEQSALNCGHCTPNEDEIACGCQIEERDETP